MLYPLRPQIQTVEREVQKMSSDMTFENNESIECIKEQIAHVKGRLHGLSLSIQL